jgi:hypothetical protein
LNAVKRHELQSIGSRFSRASLRLKSVFIASLKFLRAGRLAGRELEPPQQPPCAARDKKRRLGLATVRQREGFEQLLLAEGKDIVTLFKEQIKRFEGDLAGIA